MCTDPGNIEIARRHMNVEIRTESAKFPEKEYMNGIFVAVRSNAAFSTSTCTRKVEQFGTF
jgi:hypothetical protein